jgi:excisionase family DNA binding protein
MSPEEIKRIVADYAARYPALVSALQAAEIAGVPLSTIYQWSSQGELDGCKSKRGKRMRISRDCLVLFMVMG